MKRIICLLSAVALLICALTVPAFADVATISLSKKNANVGDSVTVTLKYNAPYEMYGIDATLTYNSAVLQYVSGGNNSGSTVKFVEGLSGEKNKSFSVVFKTIAAGSGSLSFSASASGSGDGSASAGATVNVTSVQPSKNANLGSIKLSEGTLSPEFKAGTVNYTAEVKYTTDKISISANAAAGDSTVKGAGTFDLKVGENKFSLTVTAASGDKKTYTVTVKRLTEEETAAAIQAERDNNPYLIVVNEKDRLIQGDLSALPNYEGYTLGTFERKGTALGVLVDNGGKYQLFYTTDANGEDGAFYTRDENDQYTRLNYLTSGGKLYIIEPFDFGITVDPRFIVSSVEIGGKKIDCYKYAGGKSPDFCILNCYINGQSGYYRYDIAENTLQREPEFLVVAEPEDVKAQSPSFLEKISNLKPQAKMVLILLVLSAVLVAALIVLLIMKAVVKDDEEPSLPEPKTVVSSDLKFDEVTEQSGEPQTEPEPVAETPEVSEPETEQNEPEQKEPDTDIDESEFLDESEE